MTDDLPTRLAADLDGTFEELVRAFQDGVYGVALRLTGNAHEAEDVAQDAFVRAYRALGGYPPERIRALHLRPWLARIALNLVRNRARGRRTDPLPADGALRADPAREPEALAERKERNVLWAGLLAELPERYRVPVVLRCVEGLSYAELAQVLGKPTGTLRAQVHRGLGMLRAALEAADELKESP